MTYWFSQKSFIFAPCLKIKEMTSSIITLVREDEVSLPVPPSFIGKRVEVTFTALDETEMPIPEKNLGAMFRGVFSKESAESLKKHINTMRKEWDT